MYRRAECAKSPGAGVQAVVRHLMWALGMESVPSVRAAHGLHC